MSLIFIILVISYLIGSIPTSIIVGKFLKRIDIRNYGSGNAGGTNVFRILGWKAGTFVITFDMLKGAIVCLWVASFFNNQELNQVHFLNKVFLQLLAGAAAVIGHMYTVFAGFRGGKGVSAAAGMMIAIAPVTISIVLGVFLLTMIISRYVSLASMIGAISFPIIIAVRKYIFNLGNGIDYYANILGTVHLIHDSLDPYLIIFGIVFAFLITYAHRSNIKRLFLGTENKVHFFSSKS